MNLTLSGASVELEARLSEPSGRSVRGSAVVCHPHPLYGGTMDNRVVYRSHKAAIEAGMATLRFNFRGVGASTGSHDRGQGEADDVSTAIDFMSSSYPSEPVFLIGFSFGALVGLRVGSTDARVKALVGLGAPVGTYDFGFLLEDPKPTLFVVGTEDQFCDNDKMSQLAESMGATGILRWIDGADHFFAQDIVPVQKEITRFLEVQAASSESSTRDS